jgi:hypothetical protein
MHILIVNFKLNGPTYEQLLESARDSAAPINAMQGFIEKSYLWDADTNTTGGVYKFQDKASVDAYLASDFWAEVCSNSLFTDMTVRQFSVLEEASRLTNGIAEVAVS